MKASFKAQFLQHLAKKKNNAGFTLIELLVVIIIVGVLSAVALPNLLGQVGKARETEAKTALGSLNRAQQANYLEKGEFYAKPSKGSWSNTESALGVVASSDFYSFSNPGTASRAEFRADGSDPQSDGTRDYASGVNYDAGNFETILCVADQKENSSGTLKAKLEEKSFACNGDSSEID